MGEDLAVNADTGLLQAVPVMIGTDPSQNWVQPILVPCDPAKLIEVDPAGQPPGGDTVTGGTGGGQCCPPPKIEFVCPKPGELNCGPNVVFPKPKPKDPNDDVCDAIEAALDNLNFEDLLPWSSIAMGFGAVGFGGPGGQVVEAIVSALIGSKEPVIPALINRVGKWLKGMAEGLAKGVNCDRDKAGKLSVLVAALNMVQKYTGIVPPPLLADALQSLRYACQTELPSGQEANMAWLADEINDRVWECWTKANGLHAKQWGQVRDAQRQRLSPQQAFIAWRRGIIDDERLKKLIREGGVITDQDSHELKEVQQWYPTGPDLIRWMAKDVGDPDTRAEFRLDEEFPQKFQGRLKQLAEGAGISEEFMKNAWAAHWQNVGTTTHFNALHRLREGEVPANLVTTPAAVRKSLLQQDYPPYWVDRMMALSYKVVTRIDARRMYQLHVIDEDKLTGLFQDEGYSLENAQLLAEGMRVNRKIAEVKASGLPTMRTLIMQYARGEVTGQDMRDVLEKISINEDQMMEALQSAELARDTYVRATAIKGIRRQFVSGLIDEGDATHALATIEVDSDEIDKLLFLWSIDKQKRGKVPSAAQLCKWRYLNLITPIQQAVALVRVGWSAPDAARIVKECDYEVAKKREADQERAERAAEREAKKQEAANKAAGRTRRNGQPAASPAS